MMQNNLCKPEIDYNLSGNIDSSIVEYSSLVILHWKAKVYEKSKNIF